MEGWGNVLCLAICWASTLSSSTLLTSLCSLAARYLGANTVLATFSLGVFLLAVAFVSVPSAWMFDRWGRFWVFVIGSACGVAGGLAGALSCEVGSLGGLYASCFLIGLAQGLGQFYRFAAMEVAAPKDRALAVTLTLSGGVVAAFAGPELAIATKGLLERKYVASYLVLSAINVVALFVLPCVDFTKNLEDRAASLRDDDPRPLTEIVGRVDGALPVAVGTTSYATMVMVMSPLTLAMDDSDIASTLALTTLELHFLAMFAPGFVTGKLIEWFGTHPVGALGTALCLSSAWPMLSGRHIGNYIAGMVIVGVAWNLAFSASSLMLADAYRPSEATKTQACNDFIVFGVSGCLSLVAGWIYEDYGWNSLIWTVEALNGILLLVLLADHYRRHPTRRRNHPSRGAAPDADAKAPLVRPDAPLDVI